jgi:lysophospholipid acyltransferase (LPLAT)-like uncharacterized protein
MAVDSPAMEDAATGRAGDLLGGERWLIAPFRKGPFDRMTQSSLQQPALAQARTPASIQRAYAFSDLSSYSFKDRLLIRAADLVFFLLIKLICATVKYEVEGSENWEAASRDGKLPIYTFWHNRIFLGTYFFRRRGIVIMSSRSFDAEYTGRVIKRFGYGTVRGSSTRGAIGALVEMLHLIRAGYPAGFSIDGPKGPRYVAKMGAVLLAKKTGNPVLPFTLAAEKFWEVKKSWDRFQIPKPFTRALVTIAPPIYVPAEADGTALAAKRDELQLVLNNLNERGEQWRAGISSN